jgi:drug/metabolite transporter (DMT)-like permease
VFFSWLLLGERVTLQKVIGGAIVILGVMLSLRKSKPELRAAEAPWSRKSSLSDKRLTAFYR